MGRYQQWLLCQETDQSLRAQLERLEAELASLQERMSVLERSLPHRENRLVRLLMEVYVDGPQRQREASSQPQAGAKGAAAPAPTGAAGLSAEVTPAAAETMGRLTPRILPPLHPASQLPAAQRSSLPGALPEAKRPSVPPSPSGSWPLSGSRSPAPAAAPREPPIAARPSAAAEPGTGGAGLPPREESVQVDRSQLEIPAWLHHLTVASGKDHHPTPIDQASVRTNRLVQRWLERWGRTPASPQLPAPPEDATNG
jgi:hypothetical protein